MVFPVYFIANIQGIFSKLFFPKMSLFFIDNFFQVGNSSNDLLQHSDHLDLYENISNAFGKFCLGR